MRLHSWVCSILALAALGISLVVSPARAAEDAGTQSVFAYGTGGRALAMGSAFVATANDASAMYWNPAGLGLVSRGEFQFNQSADLGAGFQESYAALALPSWRWGTVGVTLRHFGVGEIDRRDSRNVPLDNADDSEIEMAIGYGRTFGEIWRVGGAAKMQRQSVAGFSGSGLGLDIGMGVQPRWAVPLRFGLSVRNAVQPSIRLDRESLPDPMVVRSGVAYHTPIGGITDLLAEVDLEQVQSAATHMRAGLELRLRDQAALRLGMNGGVLTGGSELRWRNFALDYSFENNALAMAQRVGVTMSFGSTVDESRQAALRAEDDEMQRRLAEAFQARQARQVEDLIARGEALRVAGLYDEALEALGSALTFDSTNSVALRRQVQCLTGKAALLEHDGNFAAAAATYDLARAASPRDTAAVYGAMRCRAESDRRAARTEEIRKLFATAMDALAAEDFATARDRFTDVLKRDPGDEEAARMLARTRQALSRQATSLIAAAQEDVRRGQLTSAAVRLDEAARLDPAAPRLAEVGLSLARARQVEESTTRATRATTSATAVPARPRSTLSDHEVEQLYNMGLAALRAQRTEEALRYWEHVWAERPGYREVGALLKREYLARGMEAFAAGKLEEAVTRWEQVLRIDPADAKAIGYMERARKQLIRTREILGSDE